MLLRVSGKGILEDPLVSGNRLRTAAQRQPQRVEPPPASWITWTFDTMSSLRILGALALATTANAFECEIGTNYFYSDGCGAPASVTSAPAPCGPGFDACFTYTYQYDYSAYADGCEYKVAYGTCTTTSSIYDCSYYDTLYAGDSYSLYTFFPSECVLCSTDNCAVVSKDDPYSTEAPTSLPTPRPSSAPSAAPTIFVPSSAPSAAPTIFVAVDSAAAIRPLLTVALGTLAGSALLSAL